MKTIAEGYNYLVDAFSNSHKFIPAGTTIYEAGQPANRLYIVNQGTVRVTDELGGRGVIKGQIFGEETAYRTTYLSTARTMRNTGVDSINRSELQLLTAEHPEATLVLFGMAMGERVNGNTAAPYIGSLTGTDIQILQQAAAGFEKKSMKIPVPGIDVPYRRASVKFYKEKTLFNLTTELLSKLDASEMSQAVFTAYECGFIHGEEVVQGVDLSRMQQLSDDKLQLMQMFTMNGGEFSSTFSLAQAFHVEENTIRGRLRDISHTIGAKNRIHAGMMYLVARDTGLLADVA